MFLLIVLWILLGVLWVFLDSRKTWKKKKTGLPPFVWLIVCIGAGIWAIPIYWIVRKPRRKTEMIIAIFSYWVFIILMGVILSMYAFYRNSIMLEERHVLVKEIKVGMVKEDVTEILWPALMKEIFSGAIFGPDSNTWVFSARNGKYTLIFDNDTLREMSFTKD